MKWIALIAILMLAAGCARDRVKLPDVVHVEVPVPVRPVPPDVLLACGLEPPGFRFYDHEGHALIHKNDHQAFQAWINRKNQCLQAWRNWSEPMP